MGPALPLFAQDQPPGFSYREDLITAAEEAALLEAIGALTLAAQDGHQRSRAGSGRDR